MATGHETHALVAMTASFTKLPQWAQIVSILGAVFMAGGGTALATRGFTDLGPRVDTLERAVLMNDSLHADLDIRLGWIESDARADRIRIERKLDQLICFADAQRGVHSYEICLD